MATNTEFPIVDFNGFISDKPPRTLPPNTMTRMSGCSIINGAIQPQLGFSQYINTPTDPPYNLVAQTDSGNQYWYYGTDTKIYQSDGTTETDVSRLVGGAYATDPDIGWDGGVYNGLLVFTNGVDEPQGKVLSASDFSDLANFPANTYAKHIRAYQNRLVAFGINESGTSAPYTVLISDAEDPGVVPGSWDYADPTTLANRIELASTPGYIVDAVELNGSLLVFKTDSVWKITFVGGDLLDRVDQVIGASGALSDRCVKVFNNQCFVVGHGVAYVTDGISVKPILEDTNKNLWFSNINTNLYHQCFVASNSKTQELYFCFPGASSTSGCSEAWVWNWNTGNFGHMFLPSVVCGIEEVLSPSDSDAWDDNPGLGQSNWDDVDVIWDINTYDPSRLGLVWASTANTQFYFSDSSGLVNGVDVNWLAERVDLAVGNEQSNKTVVQIVPHIISESLNATVHIRAGSRQSLDSGISWSPLYGFAVGTDFKTDTRVTGRYIAYRISGQASNRVRITGVSLYGSQRGLR